MQCFGQLGLHACKFGPYEMEKTVNEALQRVCSIR
jgi:hypothetical protein